MAFSISFNEEKNQLLKATRAICFEDVLEAIKKNQLLANSSNPNNQRPHQKIYIIEINRYAYVIPYVINEEKKEIFLKTIYPSRVFTRKYLKKRKDGDEK